MAHYFKASHLQACLGLVIFALALSSIRPIVADYANPEAWQGVVVPRTSQMLEAGLATCLSYGAIACYDFLAFAYVGYGLDRPTLRPKILFAGLLTYTISPNLGFAFLSGGAIRYRFYGRWGVPPLAIAQVILFSNGTLWVGLCAVAGFTFWLEPIALPPALTLPLDLAHLDRLCLGITAAYLCLCALGSRLRQWGSPWIRTQAQYLPTLALAGGQILIFALDWGFAALGLYSLLNLASVLSFGAFFGIYTLAMVAGLLSTVPGGLGVLETVMLYFLTDVGLDPPFILGRLLVFRGIYYWLPLGLAIVALGIYELKTHHLKG
ncbi:putative bifunctional lysylphosphatidylglycerol flippase/synthetase [Prochlorothrix hollandica]|uniref:Integral membrane protein n=1 Tax=Prochlorothrix hollandica PCC 9006 = CALU 1027 TaxID=317619 RepID=A0A0M2Q1A3_PROHO|nr:UPF0104 family protein [Prochlorothrix hollandica]KKJ00402.1 hypothetical protein PROH_12220 [Prochlorothrix hollandica PCC 9006 = CALU 1027]